MKSVSIQTAVGCLEPDLPFPMLQWGQEILCASSTRILAYTLHPKTPHIFPPVQKTQQETEEPLSTASDRHRVPE